MVRDVLTEKRRFGEFPKSLGVVRNILTARLKKLVADGVAERAPVSDGSAFKESALTDKGRGLLPVIVSLGHRGCMGSEFKLVDRKKGRPVCVDLRCAHRAR